MGKLYEILNTSSKVTVYETVKEDFHQYGEFLGNYYRELSGIIKQNHIFSCNIDDAREGNKFNMTIKENDLENATTVKQNMIKQNFRGRGKAIRYSEAVKMRPRLIKHAVTSPLLKRCVEPGIPPYSLKSSCMRNLVLACSQMTMQ